MMSLSPKGIPVLKTNALKRCPIIQSAFPCTASYPTDSFIVLLVRIGWGVTLVGEFNRVGS